MYNVMTADEIENLEDSDWKYLNWSKTSKIAEIDLRCYFKMLSWEVNNL